MKKKKRKKTCSKHSVYRNTDTGKEHPPQQNSCTGETEGIMNEFGATGRAGLGWAGVGREKGERVGGCVERGRGVGAGGKGMEMRTDVGSHKLPSATLGLPFDWRANGAASRAERKRNSAEKGTG